MRLARRHAADDDAQRYIDVIRHECDRLATLVDRRHTPEGALPEGEASLVTPENWVRDHIQAQRNYFAYIEEAAETLLAAKDGDKLHLIRETADLWFHCMVLLAWHGARPEDVLAELARREGTSGIDEKSSRV